MLDIVELSRLQFALTAINPHFLFVPLTLGMGRSCWPLWKRSTSSPANRFIKI